MFPVMAIFLFFYNRIWKAYLTSKFLILLGIFPLLLFAIASAVWLLWTVFVAYIQIPSLNKREMRIVRYALVDTELSREPVDFQKKILKQNIKSLPDSEIDKLINVINLCESNYEACKWRGLNTQ